MRRFSLALKLTLGFAIVLFLFTAVSVFTALRLEQLNAKDTELRALAERQETALTLKSLVEQMDAIASGYMISGKPELEKQYMEKVPELTRLTELVGASAETRDQRNWRARLTMVSQEFVDHFERSAAIVADASTDAAAKQPKIAAAFNASQIHKQVIFELVQSFYDDYSRAEGEARAEYSALIEGTRAVALVSTGAAFAVAAAIAAVVVRSLTAGVRRLRLGIERVKSGDLSRDIAAATKDELGALSDDFDASVAAVRGMLARTKGIAEALQAHSARLRDVAGSTKDANASIVRAMEEISAGSAKQAEQTEQGVAAISELEERMDGVLSATSVLTDASDRAKTSLRDGETTVRELEARSERTGEALRDMSAALTALESRAADIFGMTNAIHDISQQTNILALNASIEAARAGEHGRGFSVIAEEVRLLSLQATEASRRIDDMLSPLQSGMQEAARSLASTADSFADQRRAVSDAGAAFEGIVRILGVFEAETRRIGERVNEAKRKQAELVGSVHVVASVAQQTAAGVEETASAAAMQDEAVGRVAEEATELHELAETLFGEIDKFRV
ncbi:methyl-accepting chemotaxis protein [Paenibacillus sp.]|uniref:methyl-accepting chemotaxis protein n=1 Tax=Paenibacillus sp. TaxID=58172 RepID=UPI0028117874|nr:methyl-accepting chemotaxis protein [Paenibacillus sp.]